MSHPVKTLAQAVEHAQTLMADWIVPEGASDRDTLGELVGVLDNRQLNAAQRALAAPYHKGINPKLLEPRHKVAHDLLRKYGVMVDPESLSDAAINRLQSRTNYPRLSDDYTLREWSDLVLGEGEQVRFYLPQSPRRNTHLGTVQYLSSEAGSFIGELVKSVQSTNDEDAETHVVFDEDDEEADQDDIPLTPREPAFVHDNEAEAITAGATRGINTLHALKEEAEERWSPAIQDCIAALLDSHKGEEEVDTLDVMVELVNRLDRLAREARKVLDERRNG
ncbi:hypothetical protein ACIPL1_25850 [Pseudomonas sp. NPDC090202]|uniref:hypothetical protein n=1 Tax=unclassified Pseudomonas TaxID=196821 RepID=UPI0038220822